MEQGRFRSKREGMCNTGLQEIEPRVAKDFEDSRPSRSRPREACRHQEGQAQVCCCRNRIAYTEKGVARSTNAGSPRPLRPFGALRS